jgi:hypothetical protein
MSRPSPPSGTVPRAAAGWLLAVALAPRLASADHLGPVGAKTGFDWTTWLLVAGAVAAVSLAAWAFFAPERPDARGDASPAKPSEPKPPAE